MYTIDTDKLNKVTEMFNDQVDPQATSDLVESEICAPWNEGSKHQLWIDSADEQEIVDWLARSYID